MIILFFIHLLLCQPIQKVSANLNLNFSNTYSFLNGVVSEDKLISIINNQGNIVIGGMMCSFIGERCFFTMLVFDNEFHSTFQKKFPSNFFFGLFLGMIGTRDEQYILLSMGYQNPFQISAYLISQNLESLTTITHSVNNASEVRMDPFSPAVELLNFYRIYFSAKYIGMNSAALFSIDIDKAFKTKVENSFDNSLQGTGCLYSTLYEMLFFKQIENFYYYGGYCLKNNFILPAIAKFDNLLHPLFSFVAPETSQYKSFYYNNLFLHDSNSLLAHYEKKDDALNQLKYDRFNIIDLTFIETIIYALPTNYYFNYSKNFLVKNNFVYTILSSSPQKSESSERLLTFQIHDRTCIINLVIDNKRYPPTNFNVPSGSLFTSFNLYNFNSTFLLSDGMFTYQYGDSDLVVQLISIINPSSPTFVRTMVYGGTGNYLSSYIINFNQSCFLIYGMDGIGMYLLFYSKENLSLITENKFRLEYHIKNFSVLLLPNNKIIIIGNYDSGTLNPFFAEVDRFLFGQPFEPFGWMKDILLMCTINIDETRFAVGGSLIESSGTSCYYAEISLDYTLTELPIIHSIIGVKCIVDLLLITEDKSKVVALGRDILSGRGLILSIKPFLSNKYLPNEKKVKFNSFSQISSDLLLGGGSLTDGTFNISYYITFSTNLEFISDWGNSKNDQSEVSNFLMVTKNISVSTTIINKIPHLRFMRVIPNLLVIDNIKFYDQLSKSSQWSIGFVNNSTILAVGSENNLNLFMNSFRTSIIKYSPKCPQKNHLYNPFDMKCYEDCTLLILENNFTCLEFQNNVCINCLVPSNFHCITDKFIPEEQFCGWDVKKLEIILESIEFDISEKSIKAKFNQNVKHFHYKFKTYLKYSNGQISSSVSYNHYRIESSEIQIYGVQYNSLENAPDLVLNLSALQIISEQGVPLSNPIIKVRVHSSHSDSLMKRVMDLQEEISNFFSRNKYY